MQSPVRFPQVDLFISEHGPVLYVDRKLRSAEDVCFVNGATPIYAIDLLRLWMQDEARSLTEVCRAHAYLRHVARVDLARTGGEQ